MLGVVIVWVMIWPLEVLVRFGETILVLLMISAAFLLPIAIFWLSQTGWAEWRAWLLLVAGIVLPTTAYRLQFDGDRIINARRQLWQQTIARWLDRRFGEDDESEETESDIEE